ncbi:hypothetical protein G9A89_007328 [Geosiphon pyriformis]|nr:hypothetical protein G9A89_007328 [Geosiphon pyriformis]
MATLPISFTVETYPAQLIDENNFQETLQRRAYTLLSTLEGKQQIAATHIEHSQAQQKERHDDKLHSVTNKFKIGNKVLLHRTKAEKQWSGKFENKWDRPFFIHKVLGNRSYKLRLDNKILAKVAHGDRLKHYHSRNNSEPLIPQIEKRPKTSGNTARGINKFGSSKRKNVLVNFAKEDSDQIEFIYTDTIISIPPYRQYLLKVNQKIQDQALLFETDPEICFLTDVTNLYLSNPEKPQSISNFAQLFLFCDIIYLFTPEEINKLNLGNLSILQQMQLKVLLNQYADVFASENEFGHTIIKHQINTEAARLIKQQAYQVPPSGNNLIKQKV